MSLEQLQPLEIELTGSTLIEASAGTGKTYTITTLFLRLLLEQKVDIDQILVVTFTIAATEELRIKLSERLHLASVWLRYPDSIDADKDPTLATLITDADASEAIVRIGDAVARLDNLSVYTIDAMCLRILQDFAFESGLPMRIDMIADDTEIRNQVARDYWRIVLGSGDDFQIDNLLSLARSPEILLSNLNDVLRRREAEIVPDFDVERVQQLAINVNGRYREIFECWKNHSTRIQEIFADEAGVLKKNSYRPESKAEIMAWLRSRDSQLPNNLHNKFKLLTSSWLAYQTKVKLDPPTHAFFDLCDGFEDLLLEYRKWQKIAGIIAARNYLIPAIDQYKSDRGQIHFEDMRTRLDTVLKSDDGAVLGERIRSLWPYALIDEFQDTDAEQFRIFSAIYADKPESGFFMIGDPKQAVYSWRGADVFTYIQAVNKTRQRYTLSTNWRSSPAMVNAVNTVFESTGNAFGFESIPFNPVTASESNDNRELIRAGREAAAMRFSVFEEATNEDIALACASDIATLLVEGRNGDAVIAGSGVTPADIAVLVRSHFEASLIQRALRRFGVRSVSMPNESIFQSIEAGELYQVLHAMAYPGREEELRAALVTNLLGYNSRDMELLLLDASRWEALIDSFVYARERWLARGFMFALQVLLTDLGVAERMLQSVDGEQRLTNVLQLAELLQIKAREIASHEELILWLKKQIEHSRPGEDALLLRLESDEDLVQIVTMHKSKGLEYPVVFIPFPMALNTGKNKSNDIVVYHDPDDHRTIIDLGSEAMDNAKGLRTQELLSEEVRLLYVALTRSRSACFLYWGVMRNVDSSALRHLVYHDSDKLNHDKVLSGLQQLVSRSGGCIEMVNMQVNTSVQFEDVNQTRNLTAPSFNAYINNLWGMNSYTGLLRGKDTDLPDYDEVSQAQEEASIENQKTATADEAQIASLPAGARTGTLLHEIFEFMDFTDPSGLGEQIQSSMLRHGNLSSAREDKEKNWAQIIETIVLNSISANLDANGTLSLKNISNSDRLNEMEFFFSLSNLKPESLQSALNSYPQYSQAAVGLKFREFEGLMQGFIDMVIRKDNCYFIVDYKSNKLGETLDSYSHLAIKEAINSHRYNLQYLIYTVALHRYLGRRIAGYHYETHFGGVYYLFNRGMRPEKNSGVWFDKPPFDLINALDQMMQTTWVPDGPAVTS